MPQFQLPDFVGAINQGQDRGRALQANQLAGQAYGSQGADRQAALSQLAGLDPRMAVGLGNNFAAQDQAQQSQQQAQEADHAKKLNGAARYMLQAVQSNDPARVQGAWQSVRPYLAQLTGKQPPEQFDPAMLPKMYEIVGQTGGEPAAPAGVQEFQQMTQGLSADQVEQARLVNLGLAPKAGSDTGELATLRAVQGDPALLSTYQKMHPRASSEGGGGSGFGRAPSGYRYTKDGSLEAIPGGPADSSGSGQGLSPDAVQNAAWAFAATGKLPPIGRGKEGVAQRTAIMNETAKVAKSLGVSPAELQTVPGRNKAFNQSLTNLQKRSDSMETSETAFNNNAKVMLDASGDVSRSDSPILNKWILGAKEDIQGDPKVSALNASIRTVATDYARIMSGNTGAGGTPISTTEDAIKLIRKELSDKSLRAVMDILKKDIAGQQQAVHQQRGKILGAMQMLHDEAAPGGMSGASDVPSSPQSPSNDADPLGIL